MVRIGNLLCYSSTVSGSYSRRFQEAYLKASGSRGTPFIYQMMLPHQPNHHFQVATCTNDGKSFPRPGGWSPAPYIKVLHIKYHEIIDYYATSFNNHPFLFVLVLSCICCSPLVSLIFLFGNPGHPRGPPKGRNRNSVEAADSLDAFGPP